MGHGGNMNKVHLTAVLVALATPAAAEAPLTAAEFDAYVTGKTISFGNTGDQTFGVEMYLPNQRVIWSATPGVCTNGVWYESKGDICFKYDGDPEPKCWAVYADPNGLRAVYTTRPDTTVIFEATDEVQPLICDNLSS
jgi:hypothetical protein